MSATAHATTSTQPLDLSVLRRMSFTELQTLYRAAKRPLSLSDLDGDAQGAMLAWRSPASGPLAWLLSSFGSSSVFPWKGKSFKSQSNDQGEGINRIDLGLLKTQWFPFGTRFDASFLDGEPAFVLDYSRPGNPPVISQIVDEVREVGPGLYMGPAALRVGGKPRPILFFALSFQKKN
jgi:hypothetical protein